MGTSSVTLPAPNKIYKATYLLWAFYWIHAF
jgi:hypothetical protein